MALLTVGMLAVSCGDGTGDTDLATNTTISNNETVPTAVTAPTAPAPSDALVPSTSPGSTPPVTAPTTGVPVTEAAVVPAGFGTISATITKPDGSTCDVCLWLAADPPQRSLGLMRVTSLAGYDGMVFRFPDDTRGGFWMKNTVMPLSIAWFSADAQFVDAADMDPCPPDTDCPSFKPSDSYRDAIEVEQGRLAEFGLVEGATIVFGAPCERSL